MRFAVTEGKKLALESASLSKADGWAEIAFSFAESRSVLALSLEHRKEGWRPVFVHHLEMDGACPCCGEHGNGFCVALEGKLESFSRWLSAHPLFRLRASGLKPRMF